MDKRDFIVNEFWILAWNASVQRARLYKEGAGHDSRNRSFREKVVGHLCQVIPSYTGGVVEAQHYTNIDNLIEYAGNVDDQLLGPLGYKYGIAQKLLNLALKYYWCLGEIAEPPHCPVDRIVISMTSQKGKINWTDIVRR